MKTFTQFVNESLLSLFSNEFKKGLKSIGAVITSSDSDLGILSYDIELNGKYFRVTQELKDKNGKRFYSAFELSGRNGSMMKAGKRIRRFSDLKDLL